MKWEVKTLGEIAEVKSGGTPRKSTKEYWSGDIAWYSSGELNQLFTKEPKEKITKLGLSNSNAKLFPKGSLLIGMYDTAALKMSLLDRDATFNQAISGVKPSSSIDLRFVFYAINSKKAELLSQRRGVRQKNLNLSKIKDIEIPVPPLEEQKRIVGILDESFEAIALAEANTKKNLANARELFDSYLNKIFTRQDKDWRSSPLGDVVNFLNGFAFKSQDTVPESNVQLIRMGNLYQNKLDLQRNPVFYPDNFKHEYSRYLLKQGDLIISLTGTVDKEDYGFTVEIPRHEGFLLLNQRIAKFIDFSPEISKEFLLYILRSKIFLKKLYASSRGVRQANLSTTEIRKIDISFPSLQKQKEEICCFRKIEQETQNLEGIYQRKLEALAELKQSILQKAFTGQLTQGE